MTPLHDWQCIGTVAEFATTGSMQQDQRFAYGDMPRVVVTAFDSG